MEIIPRLHAFHKLSWIKQVIEIISPEKCCFGQEQKKCFLFFGFFFFFLKSFLYSFQFYSEHKFILYVGFCFFFCKIWGADDS